MANTIVSIGEKVKAIRIQKGLSIRSYARIVNLSYGYIAKLEKCISDCEPEQQISPSIDVLKQICDRSHYDFKLFLEETGYLKSNEKYFESDRENLELLNILRSLPPAEKLTVTNMIKGLYIAKSAEIAAF